MLFILVTVWCCVISVCLIISHSVSLCSLRYSPSAGQAESQSRESRQPLSGRGWDLSWPDPALAAHITSLAAQTCKERSQTKEILRN